MGPTRLEAWVLDVVDRVERNRAVEDTRVELKASWPDAIRAARRIAGHANAARGEQILWIIGVDETRGVVNIPMQELSEWWPRVAAQFDGLAPGLMDLVVPTPKGAVTALLFTTNRAPYVVRTPSSAEGAITHEVPWRDGTRVRSAHRDDLIRLLSPVQSLPDLEILTASLLLRSDIGNPQITWELRLAVYVTPLTPQRVVLPFHRMKLVMRMHPSDTDRVFREKTADTGVNPVVSVTEHEGVFDAPGTLKLHGRLQELSGTMSGTEEATVVLSAKPRGSDHEAIATARRKPVFGTGPLEKRWKTVELD